MLLNQAGILLLILNLRFEESKIELENILNTPELAKVPIVVLGNKIDKKEAVEAILKDAMEQIAPNLGIKLLVDVHSGNNWGEL